MPLKPLTLILKHGPPFLTPDVQACGCLRAPQTDITPLTGVTGVRKRMREGGNPYALPLWLSHRYVGWHQLRYVAVVLGFRAKGYVCSPLWMEPTPIKALEPRHLNPEPGTLIPDLALQL